jgi:hypothetical protein
MVSAAIKFTQGFTTDAPGRSVIGVLAAAVTLTNGDNTGVSNWLWEVIDAPPASALQPGVLTGGAVPMVSFTPDARGSYLFRLTVNDLAGNVAQDMHAFAVLETTGRLMPAFLGNADTHNFSGNARGWAKYLEQHLQAIGGGGGGGSHTFTFPGNANYAVLSTDDIIEWPTLTANRTATLPAAPTVGEGHTFKVNDLGGFRLDVNGNGSQVDRPGTNPGTTAQMSTNYMSYTYVFNGTKWSLV